MDNRSELDDPLRAVPDEMQGRGTEPQVSGEAVPDQIEVGAAVKEEVERLVHHPRAEATRLHQVEEVGESAATPYLYLFHGLKFILPAAALMLAAAFLAYYLW
jgi:hypothetical protein